MTKRRKVLLAGVAVLAIAAGGAGVALAGGGEDDGDEQASGPGADRARAAALQLTGGGTANSVERDSENGAVWEVEVTQPDGATVDVRLDEAYGLVVVEGDEETADDESGESERD